MIKFLEKRLIEPIENMTYSFELWLFFFVIVVLLRNFGDALVWTHTIGHSTDGLRGQYFSMLKIFNTYALAHIHVFLIYAVLFYLFTKENILKISKVLIAFWILCWVVPIFDWIISKGSGYPLQYGYDLKELFPYALINGLNPFVKFERFSYGERIEFFILCLGTFFYTYIKTKKIVRAVVSFIVSYFVFIIFLAYIIPVVGEPIYKLFPKFNSYVTVNTSYALEKIMLTPGLIYTSDQKVGLILMPWIVLFSFLWFFIYSKDKFKSWLKNINWPVSLNYVALTIAGIIFGYWRLKEKMPQAFTNPTDYFAFIMLPLAIFFGYQHIRIIKRLIKEKTEEQNALAIILLLLAGFCAINISYWALLYLLVFLLLYYFYLLPPLKVGRFPLVSNIILSLTFMFSIFLGMGLMCDREAVHLLPWPLWKAGFFWFLLASSIKEKSKIKNQKSKILIAGLVFLGFFLVPFFLNLKVLILPALIFGILGGLLVFRKKWQPAYFFSLAIVYYVVIMFFIKKFVRIEI